MQALAVFACGASLLSPRHMTHAPRLFLLHLTREPPLEDLDVSPVAVPPCGSRCCPALRFKLLSYLACCPALHAVPALRFKLLSCPAVRVAVLPCMLSCPAAPVACPAHVLGATAPSMVFPMTLLGPLSSHSAAQYHSLGPDHHALLCRPCNRCGQL